MKDNRFSEDVTRLLWEKPRWWVRWGNFFVLLFISGLFFFLSQVKTEQQVSAPVYFLQRQGSTFYFKTAPMSPVPGLTKEKVQLELYGPWKANDYTLQFPEQAFAGNDSLILFSIIADSSRAAFFDPAFEAGKISCKRSDMSLLRCFLDRIF